MSKEAYAVLVAFVVPFAATLAGAAIGYGIARIECWLESRRPSIARAGEEVMPVECEPHGSVHSLQDCMREQREEPRLRASVAAARRGTQGGDMTSLAWNAACYWCETPVRCERNDVQGWLLLREIDVDGIGQAEHTPERCASLRHPDPARVSVSREDLRHALGRCGCEQDEIGDRDVGFMRAWPAAHTAALDALVRALGDSDG